MDESGTPLPGENITIKDTTEGIQTNFDGEYSIGAVKGQILKYQYIGMKTEYREVTDSTTINVTLLEDSMALDEVVVAGYASGVSVGRTGAVSSIRGEKGSRLSNGNFRSGTLTAGELNDLENFKEWQRIMAKKEYEEKQNAWKFYLEHKVEVSIVTPENEPASNVKVALFEDAEDTHTPEMITRTDAHGKTVLFMDFSKPEVAPYYYVQIFHGKKVIGRKIKSSKRKLKFVLNHKPSTQNVDIMFTIDATGSMGDEMEYLKEELRNIFKRVDTTLGIKRMALTLYRDHGDEYVVRDFDFSADIDAVQENLNKQYATGGGDYEEAVEKALSVSMAQNWDESARTKIMFLLLDAPPHCNEENVKSIKQSIRTAQQKGIKIIPIVASGADKTVEFLMRFFSLSTNGTYVFLTDDSGVGNPHLKPTTEDYKVEKLAAYLEDYGYE
ncbi:MAG: carboxypeptidase-like regulatory domain-containing protein, partial [Bacteroidota bacterium]